MAGLRSYTKRAEREEGSAEIKFSIISHVTFRFLLSSTTLAAIAVVVVCRCRRRRRFEPLTRCRRFAYCLTKPDAKCAEALELGCDRQCAGC